MITHDLRGPLSGLIGALELLDDESLGPLGTDQHLFVRQSLQNSQLLNDMVSDLLDVYRLEASGGELRGEPVDLHALADLADMQVRGAIVEKRLTLDNAIAADLPRIWGDRNKLLRVFANLLHNAVKYTDRGGITLSAEISPDNGFAHAAERGGPESPPGVQYLIVHVRDTGVGIPDDARAYVFEKFYRVSQRTPGRAPRGTGLGLYFCKRVVEAHGGNIWVDPAPNGGRGSVFSFSVPVSVPA